METANQTRNEIPHYDKAASAHSDRCRYYFGSETRRRPAFRAIRHWDSPGTRSTRTDARADESGGSMRRHGAAAQAEEMEDGPLWLRRKRALGLCGSGAGGRRAVWVMGGVKVSIGQTLAHPGRGPDPFFPEVYALSENKRSDGLRPGRADPPRPTQTHGCALFNSPHCVL